MQTTTTTHNERKRAAALAASQEPGVARTEAIEDYLRGFGERSASFRTLFIAAITAISQRAAPHDLREARLLADDLVRTSDTAPSGWVAVCEGFLNGETVVSQPTTDPALRRVLYAVRARLRAYQAADELDLAAGDVDLTNRWALRWARPLLAVVDEDTLAAARRHAEGDVTTRTARARNALYTRLLDSGTLPESGSAFFDGHALSGPVGDDPVGDPFFHLHAAPVPAGSPAGADG